MEGSLVVSLLARVRRALMKRKVREKGGCWSFPSLVPIAGSSCFPPEACCCCLAACPLPHLSNIPQTQGTASPLVLSGSGLEELSVLVSLNLHQRLLHFLSCTCASGNFHELLFPHTLWCTLCLFPEPQIPSAPFLFLL